MALDDDEMDEIEELFDSAIRQILQDIDKKPNLFHTEDIRDIERNIRDTSSKIGQQASAISSAFEGINRFKDILPQSIISGTVQAPVQTGVEVRGLQQQKSLQSQFQQQLTEEIKKSPARIEAVNEEIERQKRAATSARDAGLTSGRTEISEIETQLQQKLEERDTVTLGRTAEEQARLEKEATELLTKLNTKRQEFVEFENTSLIKLQETQQELEEEKTRQIDEEKKYTEKLADAREKSIESVKKLTAQQIDAVAKGLQKTADALGAFVTEIRSIQQQFGIDAGQAASLAGRDFRQSIGSMAGALTGQEAFVTREQIQQGRSAFQGEFGGLISPDEARAVAQRSAQEGITAQQQAMARRVFITESRGDVGGAERRETQFLEQFKNANLTAKDAMDAIAKNSELLYRAGDRFRDSITKAAIEAKKIGVDLSSIERFGDNLINNFEGFLEGQAELGAMGFGFDTSRLSEIAAGGDTGALMEELQSQLASTGKNLDTLSRPERLAIESAFGMSIGDMKKLTSGEGGSGKSMEDLQALGNKSLEKLVNVLSGLVPGLAAISAILGGVHTFYLMSIERNTRLAAAGAGVPGTGGRVGELATAAGGRLRTGMGVAGTGMGLASAGIGTVGGTAIGMSQGGSAAGSGIGSVIGTVIGGAIGSLVAPGIGTHVGMMAGGLIGGGIGGALTADDMVSKPGYGERVLLHANEPPIALNDLDTVVAYADDLVSSESGVKLLSKGDAAPSLDISPLEAKLDAVVQTIQQMSQQTAASHDRLAGALAQRKSVYLNGNQVGYEMAENETSAAITAPFRVARTNRG
jgi:hypothetical protein